MAKRYVSTGEAADYLGIHPETLRRWVTDGLVTPTFRTPRRGDMRWDLDDLDRQLHNQPTTPTATTGEPVPEPPADKPQRPAVITGIVTSKRGVLIGKRNDGKPPWTFIAGENEPGESPADTIIREVKEETGLEIVAGPILGERVHPKTGRHMVYVAAGPRSGNLTVYVGDEDELAEVRWANLTEADKLLPGMFGPVREHLERVLSA
jgi:8-oxo-dGTP pyrophosphatase MutT (NUDIX family)